MLFPGFAKRPNLKKMTFFPDFPKSKGKREMIVVRRITDY